MTAPLPPRTSLVMEWGNAVLAGDRRARAALSALAREVTECARTAAIAPPLELVIVYDELRCNRCALEARAGDPALASQWIRRRFVPARGAGYYELKNRGAEKASGELVVLLDSDVEPEPGWLAALLGSFADPGVAVVGGNSYVPPIGPWSRAFALGWQFPLRASDGPLRETQRFHSNNVAFRAEVLRRHPFPSLPGSSRGAGSLLATELLDAGIRIQRNPRARVAHPPPRARHYLRRGVAHGRDALWRRRRAQGAMPVSASVADAWRRGARAFRRILRQRRRIGMGAAEVPIALAVMGGYYALFLAGDLLTRAAPRWTARIRA